MKTISDAKIELLEDAVNRVIACRDFCGNEREALQEWQEENGKLSVRDYVRVRLAVEARWNDFRKQAGVRIK